MRKIIFVILFTAFSMSAYSQQTLRIGNVAIKDTLNGEILFKDGVSRANIYLGGLYVDGQIVSETSHDIVAPQIFIQSGLWPSQSIYLNSDGNTDYGVEDNKVHNFKIQGESIFTISQNGLQYVGALFAPPILIENIGEGEYEIDGSKGNIWYLDEGLTQDISITIANIAEGQELTVYIKGGMNLFFSAASINWIFHGSAGTEVWANHTVPSQSESTDEYKFTKINGILYSKRVAQDYQ